MRRILALGSILGVLLLAGTAQAQYRYAPPPGPPPPPPPSQGVVRQGFLWGIGLGAGSIGVSCNGCTKENLGGISAEFHVGGMLTPTLALLFDGSIVIHPYPDGSSLSHEFNAAMLRGFLGDRFWVQGGLGLGRASISDPSGNLTAETKLGVGVELAGGWEFLQSGNFTVDAQARVTAAAYPDQTDITNVDLAVGLNWY